MADETKILLKRNQDATFNPSTSDIELDRGEPFVVTYPNTKPQMYIGDGINKLKNLQPVGTSTYGSGTGIVISSNTISIDPPYIDSRINSKIAVPEYPSEGQYWMKALKLNNISYRILPDYNESDVNKVLMINSSGNLSWVSMAQTGVTLSNISFNYTTNNTTITLNKITISINVNGTILPEYQTLTIKNGTETVETINSSLSTGSNTYVIPNSPQITANDKKLTLSIELEYKVGGELHTAIQTKSINWNSYTAYYKLADTSDSSEIQNNAISKTVSSNKNSITYSFASTDTDKYLMYAYPKSLGPLTSIIIDGYEQIGGFNDVSEVTISDVNYYTYISKNAISIYGGGNITVYYGGN